MKAHITTNTPVIHALNRVIVVILSESVLVFGMGADSATVAEEIDTYF
jgi:hypothetical protein